MLEADDRFPGREQICLAPAAMRMLLDHEWPGIVREPKNLVDYTRAVGNGSELKPSDLPPEFSAAIRQRGAKPATPTANVASDEKTAIEQASQRTGGNIGPVAAALRMSRPTFWRKPKKYGI